MEIIASIVLFLILMAAIVLFGHRRYSKPAQIYEQLGIPLITGMPSERAAEKGKRTANMVGRIGGMIPSSPQSLAANRDLLVHAGYRSDNAPLIFSGLRIVAALCLIAVGFMMQSHLSPNPALRIIFLVGCGGVGYIAPSFVLGKKIKKRQLDLRLSLPDALDLMVIAVEAGLGMDQAISYVAKEMTGVHQALSEEFRLMGLEMRAGKRRTDALNMMALRTGEPDIRKLVSVLTQTDRFGTSMAGALKTHSEHMRIERRQNAEEKAAKIGVKLVFPIFFCIMPSMLLVSVGPGILGIFKHLFPMMHQFANQ
jgi:tight adherence protein C